MFFTQEDFERIHNWLKIHGKKDSSLELADNFKGNEELAIIQDNKNKKLSIKTLVQELYDSSVGGIINVTDKFGVSHIGLKEAIKVIPNISRKKGQIITFLNSNNTWKVYQFHNNNIENWENLSFWKDLYLGGDSGISNVAVDEEDLTIAEIENNKYIKFKDRLKFNQDNTLNYIICRREKLDLKFEDAIYIIKFNFDLLGKVLYVPKNSYIYIEGGSITNGTILGNNTGLIYRDKCSLTNIKFKGTWNNNLYIIVDDQIEVLNLEDIKYKLENNILTDGSVYIKHLSEELFNLIKDNSNFVAGEDLFRKDDGEIVFSDKLYDKNIFSGKGRIYLRKNIVDGENILRQNMINIPNTIYINQYDYTLLNRDIIVPENSVIINLGGSFKEGRLLLSNFNNTLIDYSNTFVGINLDIKGVLKTISLLNTLDGKQLFSSIINKNEW